MKQVQAFLMAAVTVMGLTACCFNFGPVNVPNNQGGQGNQPGDNAGHPAERAAIEVVKNHGGWVKEEAGHVIEVNLLQPEATDDTLKDLATLTRVRTIKVNSQKVTGAGLKHLVGLKDLTELDLWGSAVDNAHVKDIAALTQLRILVIGHTKITDAALPELAPLTQLEELGAASNFAMTNTAGVNIAKSLPQLKVLKIDNTSLGDLGVKALAEMPNLRYLQMYGTSVTDEGIAALPKLKNLEHLALGFGVTDDGLKSVAACTKLQFLSIFNARVSDAGLRDLAALTQLKTLEIRNGTFGRITGIGLAEFMKTHPNCSVKGP